ncbi:MAG TPA: tetratricopeptide repeat protein [Alphaproteobacteria bacterium]|nr:tetratricopeptide repeat protein [Alphaproteobacteria bacterium]
MKLLRLIIGLGCLTPLSALSALAAATVRDIRIAAHPDHVRVVLDLDGPVTSTPRGDHELTLHGLSGGSAVMNAQPKDAPLKRVVLTPDGDDTTLSFETSADIRMEAFPVSAGGGGGNRFVVDLYRATETPAAQTPALSSDLVATTAPPPQFASRGPAVPAVPSRSPLVPTASDASRTNTFSFVPPYNAPQAGPTPYEAAENQSQTPAATPTATGSSLPATSASAPPTNTVPFGQQPGQPESAESGAPPTATVAAAASASTRTPMSAPSSDRALLAERALDRGDAKAACAAANEALSASPQDLRALAVLGSCELALGDAVSARSAFSGALAIDPAYHRARIGLAETDVRQGDLSAARQEYQRVLADNPPTDETYKILDALQSLALPGTMSAATSAPASQSAAN